jgi:hypothetical protein
MKGHGKKRCVGSLLLVVTLFLCGCNAGNKLADGQTKTESSVTEETYFDFLDETNLAWEDNALDDLRAVINLPLPQGKATDGERSVGRGIQLRENGCICCMTHRYDNSAKNWTEIHEISKDGNEISHAFEPDREKGFGFYDKIGIVSGGEGYVTYGGSLEQQSNGGSGGGQSGFVDYVFYDLDKDFQEVRAVQVERELRGNLSDLMKDAEGNYHVCCYQNGLPAYVVISSDGKIIFREIKDGILSLCAYGGGRVAVCEKKHVLNTYDRRFYEADLKKGETRELAVSRDETVRTKMTDPRKTVSAATPVDEYRLIWSSADGLCLYDAREGETRILYEWSRHGFANGAIDLAVGADGSVGALCDIDGDRSYLLLETTGEKKEIPTITFAVAPNNLLRYQKAVTFFNKRYPGYGVSMRDDWDETSLLTQLGAGEGPVLVDTDLTGFEELEKLWQSLDGFLEQTRLADELLPAVLEFGKIGDTTYGISVDYDIHTMLVFDQALKDWTYEEWLSALEGREGAAFTYGWLNNPSDKRKDFFEILENGLNNTYYLDAETGETIFGTKEFERVVRLAEKAKKCPAWDDGKALLQGKVVCEIQYLYGLWQVLGLRRRTESDGVSIIGYPGKDGGRNLLVAKSPVCLRSTATDEEKKIAYTFLKVLLSDQEATDRALPLRWSEVDGIFENYGEAIEDSKVVGTYNPNEMPELEEGDREFFLELLANSMPKKSFPMALKRMFNEEIDNYLNGEIDGKVLAEHLKNRTWLYLEEQK